MKSVRLQLLATLAAVLAAAAIFAARGPPPADSVHESAEWGDLSAVRRSLDWGVGVNARDYLGRTPLYCAASGDRRDIAGLLIARGAELEAGDTIDRRTPLLVAVGGADGSIDVALLLIEAGADIGARDTSGNTPLHYAASNWIDTQILEALIARGADIEARNNNGETPFFRAATCSGQLERLAAHGADITAPDKEGRTPLEASVGINRNRVHDLLCRQGARE